MSTMKERMAEAKKDIANGGNYENLPLDTYNMKLTQAFVNKSKGQRNQTNFDWEVVEGELAGKTHRSFDNLDHPVGLKIFVQNMEMLGFDASTCETEEEIDVLVKKIAAMEPICTITIFEKQSKGKTYINTKLVEFLGFAKEGTEAPASEATPAPAPAEPEAPVIEVGSKLKYKAGDQIITGEVKEINYEDSTLTFPFHKGIAVDDVVGQA